MKSLTAPKRNLRTVLTDLIIYGNLAFTFVFFSAAFDRGCNNTAPSVKSDEIAVSSKSTVNPLLAEKGQTKNNLIVSPQK